MLELSTGDVAAMTSCEVVVDLEDGSTARFRYTAPKGKRFVFMLLGVESKTEMLEPFVALSDLGWQIADDEVRKQYAN